MRTIELLQTSSDIADLLDQARADDAVVVKRVGGSEYLVIALDEFEQEVAQMRKNARLMEFLEKRAAGSESNPLDVVKRRLGL